MSAETRWVEVIVLLLQAKFHDQPCWKWEWKPAIWIGLILAMPFVRH